MEMSQKGNSTNLLPNKNNGTNGFAEKSWLTNNSKTYLTKGAVVVVPR